MESALIVVDIASQQLTLQLPHRKASKWPVSTAEKGPGCVKGSGCTPVGLHRIRLKIGSGCPVGTVFRGRRPTGEIYSKELAERFPGRDWILTRILWLQGLEPGINRGGQVDTLRRYIYIHGTADEHLLGTPVSHGCIRLGTQGLLELFELAPIGATVLIQ